MKKVLSLFALSLLLAHPLRADEISSETIDNTIAAAAPGSASTEGTQTSKNQDYTRFLIGAGIVAVALAGAFFIFDHHSGHDHHSHSGSK